MCERCTPIRISCEVRWCVPICEMPRMKCVCSVMHLCLVAWTNEKKINIHSNARWILKFIFEHNVSAVDGDTRTYISYTRTHTNSDSYTTTAIHAVNVSHWLKGSPMVFFLRSDQHQTCCHNCTNDISRHGQGKKIKTHTASSKMAKKKKLVHILHVAWSPDGLCVSTYHIPRIDSAD